MTRRAIIKETAALRRYVERRLDNGVELEDIACALVTVADEHGDLVPADFDRDEPDLYGDRWI